MKIIIPDKKFEQKLRPSRFADFTEQDKIGERMALKAWKRNPKTT